MKAEDFKPLIEVKFDQVPRPIFVAALASKLWKIAVPEILKEFKKEEELEAVVKIYKDHHKKYNGRFAGSHQAKYVGFRYYRSFDESILFDKEGNVMQVDRKHIPETRAYLEI